MKTFLIVWIVITILASMILLAGLNATLQQDRQKYCDLTNIKLDTSRNKVTAENTNWNTFPDLNNGTRVVLPLTTFILVFGAVPIALVSLVKLALRKK